MNARELGVTADLIQPGDFPCPLARTEILTFDEAHPIALSEDSILFCCHATNGEEQPIEIARDFIADLIEAQDNDAILERVVSYANRLAAAAWN